MFSAAAEVLWQAAPAEAATSSATFIASIFRESKTELRTTRFRRIINLIPPGHLCRKATVFLFSNRQAGNSSLYKRHTTIVLQWLAATVREFWTHFLHTSQDSECEWRKNKLVVSWFSMSFTNNVSNTTCLYEIHSVCI